MCTRRDLACRRTFIVSLQSVERAAPLIMTRLRSTSDRAKYDRLSAKKQLYGKRK